MRLLKCGAGFILSGLLLLLPTAVRAEMLSGQVVDGLGRPVSGVKIELYVLSPSGDARSVVRIVFSDDKGNFSGMIEEAVRGQIWADILKDGYEEYSVALDWPRESAELQKLVLRRVLTPEDVDALLTFQKDNQPAKLRAGLEEILASVDLLEKGDILERLFKDCDFFIPAAQSIGTASGAFSGAVQFLSLCGNVEGLAGQFAQTKVINRNGNKPGFYLAGALVSPSIEPEWQFLKMSVLDKEDEWGTAANAALALAANGSPRALEVLQSVSVQGSRIGDSAIRRAIQWINAHPQGIAWAAELDQSITLAEGILAEPGEEGMFKTSVKVFDRAGGRAFVSVSVTHGPTAARGYDLLFQKINDRWALRGVWFTMIA